METNKIEYLISEASNTGSNESYKNLFISLKNIELFLKLKEEKNLIPLIKVGENLHAVLFFTSKDNPRLASPYGGVVWEKALEIVLNIPQADGLVIQNNNNDWIAINKSVIESLLEKYNADKTNSLK